MMARVEELEGLEANATSPPLTTFNHALIACAKAAKTGAGRMAVAYGFRVLEVMRERGVRPNIHSFGPLLDACAKVGAVTETEVAMRMMRDQGVEPNVVIYSSYVSAFAACAAAGDRSAPSQVLKVLEEMRGEGLSPNEYTYCSAVEACAAAISTIGVAASLRLGKLVIAAMRRDSVPGREVAYNSLIKGCSTVAGSDASVVEAAYSLLKEMRQNEVAPNVVTYTSMINMLAHVGDEASVKKALKLLGRMEREGIPANTITYNVVLKACAKAARGGVGGAREGRGGGQGRQGSMSLDYSKAGKQARGEQALRLLREAEGLVAEMSARGLRPDVYSYNTLLNICASVAAASRQVPREGMRVLEAMRGAGVRPSASELGALLDAAQAAEEAGEADALRVGLQLQQLLANAKAPPLPATSALPAAAADDIKPSLAASSPRHGGDGGRMEGNVVGEAVLVDAGATWEEAAILHMNALTSAGLVDAAATAMQAKRESLAGNGSSAAAMRFEAAKNVVTRMVDASATAERVKALGRLSRVERRGAMEKCISLLEDMVRAGVQPDGVTLTTVINAGKQEGSPAAVSKAYRVFQRMNPGSRTTRMYTAMISALGQGGFPDEALRVLEEAEAGVGGVELTVEVYTAAMQALSRSLQHRHLVLDVHRRMAARGLVASEVTERVLKESRRGRGQGHRSPRGRQRRQGSVRPDKRERERQRKAADRKARRRPEAK